MKKEAIRTERAPAPGGSYSQGLRAGDWFFTAGQVGIDPATGMLPEGIEAQTEQALKNVSAILEAAESCLNDVVKVTVHLEDFADFAAFDAVYRRFFDDPRPVRTTVQSGLKGRKVEIDVIACRGATKA